MIDEEITFKEKGYRSTDLVAGSHKKVYAVCEGEDCQREGGRGRWVENRQYRDLCHKCAHENPKLQKCETPTEKLPWIDDDITYYEKGYRSTELRPYSKRLVWAICANIYCEMEGGRGRWVKFCDCRELCHLCGHRTDKFIATCAELHKGVHPSEEALKKMREVNKGEKHYNWKGGVSFEPYCEKFNNAFKDGIRERFGWLCFMCLMDEQKNEKKLSVHHVNYDKECMCNGVECEFVPLCMSCHTKTGHNRELWERLIINVLYYEGWI